MTRLARAVGRAARLIPLARLAPLLLVLACPRSAPAPAPPPDPAVAVFDAQLGSRFYGLYRDGHKVGWLRSTFRRDTFRGAPTLVAEGHAEVVVKGGAAIHTTVLATRHVFDGAPPHALLRYRTSTTRDGLTESRELRAGPTGWVAATARGNEPEEVRAADIGEYTLGGFLALERWVADGPALGDSRPLQRLDTSSLRMVSGEAQVVGVTHTVIDAVPGTVYSVATFDAAGTTTTRYDGDGRILAVEGGDVELRAESEDEAKALDAPRDLFLDALITPTGIPLREPAKLSRVVYGIPEAAAALIPAASGQRVVPGGDGYVLEVAAGSYPQAATEVEQAAGLVEDAAHPRSAPRVGKLLGAAVPPRTNRRDTVRLLAEYVRDYLTDDRAAEPLDLREVIDRRRGDCTEHAALFVTLARAAGIPAREVGGLLWVEELGAFGGHAWAEVALDGRWVPVDPTWGQVPADPAHIRLADAPHLEAAALSALRSGGVVVLEAR